MCKLAGYDSRRIAKELKLPVNTVKSWWERAKVEMGIGGALLFTDDTRLAVAPLESYLFRPTIRTYAERELEASPQTSHPGAAETPIDRVEQRGYLDHALSMAQRGYLAGAEDALRLYDIEQRHNPFPSQRARLVALLAKAKSP